MNQELIELPKYPQTPKKQYKMLKRRRVHVYTVMCEPQSFATIVTHIVSVSLTHAVGVKSRFHIYVCVNTHVVRII